MLREDRFRHRASRSSSRQGHGRQVRPRFDVVGGITGLIQGARHQRLRHHARPGRRTDLGFSGTRPGSTRCSSAPSSVVPRTPGRLSTAHRSPAQYMTRHLGRASDSGLWSHAVTVPGRWPGAESRAHGVLTSGVPPMTQPFPSTCTRESDGCPIWDVQPRAAAQARRRLNRDSGAGICMAEGEKATAQTRLTA